MRTIKIGNREIPVREITKEEQEAFLKGCQLDGLPPISYGKKRSFEKDTNNLDDTPKMVHHSTKEEVEAYWEAKMDEVPEDHPIPEELLEELKKAGWA